MKPIQPTKRALSALRVLNSQHNYNTRNNMGKQIATIVSNSDLFLEPSSKKTFYISKDSDTLGQRSFTDIFQKSRPIIYTSKHSRKILKDISKVMDTENEYQIGFKKNVSVKDLYKTSKEFKGTKLLFDIKDSFNGITRDEVIFILNKGFRLTIDKATKLSEYTTHKGFLFQGSPLSPILFNIMLMPLLVRLNGFKDMKVIAYADDVTIFTNYKFFGHKFARFIFKIISEMGWIMADGKTQFKHKHYNTLGMFLSNKRCQPTKRSHNIRKLMSKPQFNNSDFGKVLYYSYGWSTSKTRNFLQANLDQNQLLILEKLILKEKHFNVF